MKRKLTTNLILVAAAGIIAGCSKDDKSTNPNPPPQQGTSVSIQGFAFSPSALTVSVGDTVTWTNLDATAHTSTSDTGLWNSGLLAQNQSFQRIFATAGTFTYHCTPHPSMTGRIIVQ
jgi:plastocyanin